MEVRTEVRTYLLRLMCDACGDGEMVRTEAPLSLMDKSSVCFEHACNKCGALVVVKDNPYPRIAYDTLMPDINAKS